MDKQPRKFEDTDLIKVMNISNGTLVYKNRVSGDVWIFDKPGDTHDMSLKELKVMRSAYRQFFKNRWIKVLDNDVVDFLRIGGYYKD